SERQRLILEFIEQFQEEHGYPPSVRDICTGCKISSTSVVDYHLKQLQREGYLRRVGDVSRGIVLNTARAANKLVRVPVVGQIAAGQPIPTPQTETWQQFDPDQVLEITEDLVRGRPNVYALRVKGVSMIDALINDGDIVLMEPTPTAENGQLVAAWIRSQKETTLKRYYLEGSVVRLQPANVQMDPIYVKADDVEVQGRVVGVIRLLP
ncbi:MAG: transcriptional repressor LexA, partial [Dehalococcoidia bacterium]|nr:transcriptional repressor LexA [Dehalococcoidia bacterium]